MSNVDPRRIVELAWRTVWPTWTQGLDFRADNIWPKIAILAVEWDRAGLTEEQMEDKMAEAVINELAEIQRRIADLKPASASTRAANTAALLASLNLGAKP